MASGSVTPDIRHTAMNLESNSTRKSQLELKIQSKPKSSVEPR